MTDFSYIGVGKVHLKEYGSAAGLTFVGNVSALGLAINEDVKELKDFTQTGGGTYNEVRRIDSVEASMTLHDLSADNLAKALFGSTSAITAAAVVDEALGAGYKGALVPFANPVNTSVAPVIEAVHGDTATTRANSTAVSLNAYLVPATPNGYFYKVTTAGTTAASPPTFGTTVGGTTTDGTATLTNMGKVLLVADTDYVVSTAGITLTDAASFTDGETLQAGYTKSAGNAVQALTSSAKEYEIFFEGLNEARSGKAVNVRLFRVKLGAAQNLALIGDDFAALELTGKVLKDTTISGAGLSQYAKIAVVT